MTAIDYVQAWEELTGSAEEVATLTRTLEGGATRETANAVVELTEAKLAHLDSLEPPEVPEVIRPEYKRHCGYLAAVNVLASHLAADPTHPRALAAILTLVEEAWFSDTPLADDVDFIEWMCGQSLREELAEIDRMEEGLAPA